MFNIKTITLLVALFAGFTISVINAKSAECAWCPRTTCSNFFPSACGDCVCIVPAGERDGNCYSVN